MAVSLLEALDALDATLQGLLPAGDDAALAREIFVNPLSTRLVGVGGVVGMNATPQGEIPRGEVLARRVNAQVVVRVKAATPAQLAAAEASLSTALLAADPVNLRSQGVFRIARSLDGADATHSLPPDAAGKDLRFDVLYEFIKRPVANEGLITRVPVDLLLHNADGPVRELLELDFERDPLSMFEVLDDGGVNAPGAWQYDALEREVRQTSGASGGSNSFNPSKRGTYLLLRAAAIAALPRNFALYASVRTDVSGGIGFVFRLQDVDNFYFALLSRPAPYRMFGKKQNDVFAFLDSGGQDETVGYEPGQWLQLRLAVQDDEFELAIDGVPVLRGRDSNIVAAGRVGFMCRNNASARFRFFRLVAL